MLRVELGHPGAALGRPPTLFGDGACGRDWMCGDPDALWVKGYSQIQPACVLDWVPVPYGGARTR